jgi:hypothetical protein
MKFSKVGGFATAMCLAVGLSLSAQETAKQDMKNAGHETKAAAKDTGHATSRVAHRGALKTKHAAHRTKAAIENTGDRIADKPPVHH